MGEIISEERLSAALNYLAETDIQYAEERAELERSEIVRKRARARCFLLASGNNEERKAAAEISPDVQQADDLYCKTIQAVETLKAKRERADIIVRVFQTLSANRRQG